MKNIDWPNNSNESNTDALDYYMTTVLQFGGIYVTPKLIVSLIVTRMKFVNLNDDI